jgi:hypothetical protein
MSYLDFLIFVTLNIMKQNTIKNALCPYLAFVTFFKMFLKFWVPILKDAIVNNLAIIIIYHRYITRILSTKLNLMFTT